jgi:hypothetical protein
VIAMMIRELALVRDHSPRRSDGDERDDAPVQAAVAARLRAAARLLEDDPDAAALLLDGLLHQIVEMWCEHVGPQVPALALQPALVERYDQPFGWRLRLALRAPDASARLIHCAALYALLDERAFQHQPSSRA